MHIVDEELQDLVNDYDHCIQQQYALSRLLSQKALNGHEVSPEASFSVPFFAGGTQYHGYPLFLKNSYLSFDSALYISGRLLLGCFIWIFFRALWNCLLPRQPIFEASLREKCLLWVADLIKNKKDQNSLAFLDVLGQHYPELLFYSRVHAYASENQTKYSVLYIFWMLGKCEAQYFPMQILNPKTTPQELFNNCFDIITRIAGLNDPVMLDLLFIIIISWRLTEIPSFQTDVLLYAVGINPKDISPVILSGGILCRRDRLQAWVSTGIVYAINLRQLARAELSPECLGELKHVVIPQSPNLFQFVLLLSLFEAFGDAAHEEAIDDREAYKLLWCFKCLQHLPMLTEHQAYRKCLEINAQFVELDDVDPYQGSLYRLSSIMNVQVEKVQEIFEMLSPSERMLLLVEYSIAALSTDRQVIVLTGAAKFFDEVLAMETSFHDDPEFKSRALVSLKVLASIFKSVRLRIQGHKVSYISIDMTPATTTLSRNIIYDRRVAHLSIRKVVPCSSPFTQLGLSGEFVVKPIDHEKDKQ